MRWGNTRFDRSTMSRRGLALFHPKLFRDSRAVLKFEDITITCAWAARDRAKERLRRVEACQTSCSLVRLNFTGVTFVGAEETSRTSRIV